jgi:hypothetical protein
MATMAISLEGANMKKEFLNKKLETMSSEELRALQEEK